MERKFIRMTRKEYEEKMRNTELYFIEDVPENEKCPVCGEHDFFAFEDFGNANSGYEHVVVKTRQTGRELLDFLNDKNNFIPEYASCVCCKTQISVKSKDKILIDRNYVSMTKKQFSKMIAERFNGDKTKFITSSLRDKEEAMSAYR